MKTLYLTSAEQGPPLIILHPAEPKFPLTARQPLGIGSAIEMPVSSEITTAGIEEDPCEPYCAGGGGGPASGIYVTSFYSSRGDGWGGSLEIQFRSIGFSGSINFLGPSTWNYSGSYCSKGIGGGTFEPNVEYSNLAVLVSPGISNILTVACGTTYGQTYEVDIVEIDGGFNGDDDFGRRVFTSGAMPYGATIGTFQAYYDKEGFPGGYWDAEYSATVKTEYR
ncbi:MAG: hypothetical protein ABJB66_12095 [Gemmatimonadaceae bacterium]